MKEARASELSFKGKQLMKYYEAMRKRFGHRDWWPGESPFEIMIGAILTQNTNWQNVVKAIDNLKANGLLEPRALHAADTAAVAALIRPSGYFNQKTKKLKAFLDWFAGYDYDIEALKRKSLASLREELMSVKGIGPETADDILLYALDMPSFVIDAYTYRVLHRHLLAGEEATYDEIKELFEDNLPKNVGLFNDFHAQFVEVGKYFCKREPECDKCPLKNFLPK